MTDSWSYMLTDEEQLPENTDEIIAYTEDVLQAKGIECDKRISEMPEEQIKEILEEVRKLRKNKKKKSNNNNNEKTDDERNEDREEEEEVEVAAAS